MSKTEAVREELVSEDMETLEQYGRLESGLDYS